MSAPARRYPLTAGAKHTGAATFSGLTVRETSGSAAAVVKVHDGVTASGDLLAVVALAAGESSTIVDVDVYAVVGVFVEIVSGAVEGSVFVA